MQQMNDTADDFLKQVAIKSNIKMHDEDNAPCKDTYNAKPQHRDFFQMVTSKQKQLKKSPLITRKR